MGDNDGQEYRAQKPLNQVETTFPRNTKDTKRYSQNKKPNDSLHPKLPARESILPDTTRTNGPKRIPKETTGKRLHQTIQKPICSPLLLHQKEKAESYNPFKTTAK